MSQQHTSTPWHVSKIWGKEGDYEIRNNGCDSHGYAPIAKVRGDKRITGGDGMECAHRIVACVNACEGIPNEALESGDLIAAHRAIIEAYKQQRDELLAVLQDAVKSCEFELAHGGQICCDIEQMNAVIAKAKGGAA